MNVPGDAGVCSKAAVAYPESHVAVASAAACSVRSKHLVYSCTSNCSAALLFALCENVIQLWLTEAIVAATAFTWCQCWFWVYVCIFLQWLLSWLLLNNMYGNAFPVSCGVTCFYPNQLKLHTVIAAFLQSCSFRPQLGFKSEVEQSFVSVVDLDSILVLKS